MPGYKVHVMGGIVAFLAVSYGIVLYQLLPWNQLVFALFSTLFGALFPDVDIRYSKGRFITYSLFFVGVLWLVGSGMMQASMCAMGMCLACFPLVVRHRTMYHNFWFVSLLAIMASLISIRLFPQHFYHIFQCTFFFLVGVASHLWLDFGLKRMFKLR